MGVKTTSTMSLPFEETAKAVLRLKIQHNYNEIKIQSNACQSRLDQVLAEVSCKNAALYALIDRQHLNFTRETKVSAVSREMNSFEDRYVDQIIPQREVYQMRIPIQSPTRNSSSPSHDGKHKKGTMSTSERYRAQYMI
jgi:hypothetical protein